MSDAFIPLLAFLTFAAGFIIALAMCQGRRKD